VTIREIAGSIANKALLPFGVELNTLRGEKPLWESDEDFNAIYASIRLHTMMPVARLYVLYQFARYARSLSQTGHTAEVGAWRGGASYLMSKVTMARVHHVFDTFEGLPEADEQRLAKGAFADTSAELVEEYLAPLGNCKVHSGLFPATASTLGDCQFSMVHIDTDLFSATKVCLEYFWPRVIEGGVVVIDDYRSRHVGVTEAVDDFATTAHLVVHCFSNGQAVIIKPPTP